MIALYLFLQWLLKLEGVGLGTRIAQPGRCRSDGGLIGEVATLEVAHVRLLGRVVYQQRPDLALYDNVGYHLHLRLT